MVRLQSGTGQKCFFCLNFLFGSVRSVSLSPLVGFSSGVFSGNISVNGSVLGNISGAGCCVATISGTLPLSNVSTIFGNSVVEQMIVTVQYAILS